MIIYERDPVFKPRQVTLTLKDGSITTVNTDEYRNRAVNLKRRQVKSIMRDNGFKSGRAKRRLTKYLNSINFFAYLDEYTKSIVAESLTTGVENESG